MVRLKLSKVLSLVLSFIAFQFHYGSIKASKRKFLEGNRQFYFNSTMVRLKPVDKCKKSLPTLNFNSTMVRLKLGNALEGVGNILFQFHYGSIKAAFFSVSPLTYYKFQFHYGSIKAIKIDEDFGVNV